MIAGLALAAGGMVIFMFFDGIEKRQAIIVYSKSAGLCARNRSLAHSLPEKFPYYFFLCCSASQRPARYIAPSARS